MRLLRIDIDEFRSIGGQWLPTDGLVVLFGPNSAGKTSVLEAAVQLVTRSGSLRSDPGHPEYTDAFGSVWFDLPDAGVADSQDAQMFHSLLRGDLSNADPFDPSPDLWDSLGKAIRERLKGADVTEACAVRERLKGADLTEDCAVLAACLAEVGTAGSPGDRELLARSIFDPRVLVFDADSVVVDMLVDGHSMRGEALEAARRIAATKDEDDDALWKVASGLTSDGFARIGRVAGGTGHWESVTRAFPPVILLDGDSESLSAEIQRAIPVIHDRLWRIDPDVVLNAALGGESVTFVDDFPIGGSRSGDVYVADPWLEAMTDEGRVVLSGPLFGPYNNGDWHRVRHSVLAAAKVIELEANRIAPSFVQSQGTIGIEVLPVSVWGSESHRVRATFAEPGGEPRDLRVVGAGTARWVAAAIRLACLRLEAGRQVVTNDAGILISDEAEMGRIVRQARNEPLTQTAVRLEPSDAAGFYIADEPEAHLHPSAVRSVRDWLTQLAETAATVLVATHNPALLDSRSQQVRRVLVVRGETGTELRRLTGALADDLAHVSEELGLTKGELLLMTRLAVFVEGPHDEIILDEWFGDELSAAGVKVFPVHGVDNLPGLAESEVVAALGIRLATLSDDVSVRRAASGRPRTRGDSAVARLSKEAARAGIEVRSFGVAEPDILYYLDETICRQSAAVFPGWQAAAAELVKAGRPLPWKKWVESEYGLSLGRENVRKLAQECRRQNKISAELTDKVHDLITYAMSVNSISQELG